MTHLCSPHVVIVLASFLLLLVLLLPHPIHSRTITWIASEGSLLDPSNWDSHTVPSPSDDAVISLPDLPAPPSSTSSPPFSPSTLLSPSFSPSSLDDELNDPPLLLTLPSPLILSSLSLTGRFTLLLDAPLTLDLHLDLSPSTTLRIRNAQLTLSSLNLHGLLSLESASLSSSPLPPSSPSSPPLSSLHIQPTGLLLTSGPGGANHLSGFDVLIDGAVVTASPPLLLSHSTLRIRQGGVWVWGGELVSVEGGEDGVSEVVNEGGGALVATGDAKQSLVVPLHNMDGGEVQLRSPGLSLLSPFTSAGVITLSPSHRLTSAAFCTLAASSSLTLASSSSLHVESASLVNAGVITGDGGVVVAAAVNSSGEVRVGKVVLKDGGVWGVEGGDAVTHFDSLVWEGGAIAGAGRVSVGEGKVNAGVAPKVVERVELQVEKSMELQPASTLLLRRGGQLTVVEGGSMTLLSSSTLRADDDGSQLLVLGSLTSSSTPAAGDDSSEPTATSLALPLTCQGNFTLTGTGTTSLHRSAVIRHLHTVGSPTLSLQATAERTSFTFDAVDMTAEGSTFVVHSANVSFTSSTPPRIDRLEVREGRVELSAGMFVRQWMVGSTQAPGVVVGAGVVEVREMTLVAGEVMMDTVNVHSSLLVERSPAKRLRVRNLTLQASSVSRLTSASLALSPSTFIAVQPSASLLVGPGVSLFTANLSAEEPDEPAGQATVRVKEGGVMSFQGSGHGVSEAVVDLVVEGAVVVNNSGNGVFTVTLHGVTSQPTASFAVSSSSSLLLACSADSSTPCNYGHMEGTGSVVVALGRHVFPSSIAVSSLSMTGGSGRFLAPLTLTSLQLALGEMLLHSTVNVTHLTWTGGALRGYPLLGSSVTVSAGGHALISSNDTLTLDGTALLLACPLVWQQSDLMMGNSASLSILPTGELRLDGGEREVQVMSDSSTARIDNAGAVTIVSPSTWHVPFINTGRVLLTDGSVLTLQADYVQAGQGSSLQVNAGSTLVKLNGDVVIVQGSLALDGVIQGRVESGGRVVLSKATAGGSLQGDLILAPSSTLWMKRDGRALLVNGSVHASGAVEVEDGRAGASVTLLTATSTTGALRPSSHQRLSYEHGSISVQLTAGAAADEVASLSPSPSLYLPFVRLPEFMPPSLASETGRSGASGEGENAVLQEKGGRGVWGWSAGATAVVVAVLASLWFIAAALAVYFACLWWREKRMQPRSGSGSNERGSTEEAAPLAAATRQLEQDQQRGQEAAVAYL